MIPSETPGTSVMPIFPLGNVAYVPGSTQALTTPAKTRTKQGEQERDDLRPRERVVAKKNDPRARRAFLSPKQIKTEEQTRVLRQVLNIFEPRYREMYSAILMSGGRRFVTTMVSEDSQLAEVGAPRGIVDSETCVQNSRSVVGTFESGQAWCSTSRSSKRSRSRRTTKSSTSARTRFSRTA